MYEHLLPTNCLFAVRIQASNHDVKSISIKIRAGMLHFVYRTAANFELSPETAHHSHGGGIVWMLYLEIRLKYYMILLSVVLPIWEDFSLTIQFYFFGIRIIQVHIWLGRKQ